MGEIYELLQKPFEAVLPVCEEGQPRTCAHWARDTISEHYQTDGIDYNPGVPPISLHSSIELTHLLRFTPSSR